MGPSSHTSNKANVQLQPNPAYGTSDKVIMDTNPAYESCKWLETHVVNQLATIID